VWVIPVTYVGCCPLPGPRALTEAAPPLAGVYRNSVKRFSEFYDLNTELRRRYPSGDAAVAVGHGRLPGKGINKAGQLNPEFIEQRR
jgi:hypothetical protein